ncbi:uncharacterized protein EAE97_010115 [Botrytis byssoidea]|uniref:Uncharacterized protein n=1 Tax=Botrytis byssoidea TaxID=139641 RepID=A0A9P5LL14_9HELO|nr:uncharacterized protein EAE97_010115 [Botrytis byssoidea]KAF7927440.1 hypothetical protein EAE97_010115 [Botrytis byssoidea]
MSPPPSLYAYPERKRERRRTRTQTHHDSSTRSPSTASTLHSPVSNDSVDSLGKPRLADQTQHRSHRPRHTRPPSHSINNTSNERVSHSRSPAAFPSTIALPTPQASAPTRLPPSPPYTISDPATFSSASTLISTEAPPIALEFLNFLDDLGILMLCKPLLELCNVEWISLFDDMGIFYLCEPIGAIRRMLRKLRIGRVDRERGGGSCLGSKERDTASWISSLSSIASEVRSVGERSREKRYSASSGKSKGNEGLKTRGKRESPRGMREHGKQAESISGFGSGSERISGANRRRSERAASSIAASHLGQSLRGAAPKQKVVG